MTVICPGCRRPYPSDERFDHGRTLHCACGARVGRRLATGVAPAGRETRFFADTMLGRLARWLRVLGYDTAWEPEISDAELVRRSVGEGRVVLTRDRRLPDEWWVDHLVLLRSEPPLEQLREVVRGLGLPWGERLFTRCSHCNAPLRPAPAGTEERLPEHVRQAGLPCSECPACGRLYWQGGHVRRMRHALHEALREG